MKNRFSFYCKLDFL